MNKYFVFVLSLLCLNSSFCLPAWFAHKKPPVLKVPLIKIYDPINFDESVQKILVATRQENVVGVILIVNSNGGGTGEFSVLYDMIKQLAAKKPVVCLVGAAALSGGYLIASATPYIFAHSLSDIGNIGVYLQMRRYKNVRIKNSEIEADCTTETFAAGEIKASENPFSTEPTEAQKAFWRERVNRSYNIFVTVVAANRHLDKEKAKEWADGKFFDAATALNLGLIDRIGTIIDAEEKIKELIKECNKMVNVETVQFVE